MAELLYRIGRFAARRHWAVIGAWLAVLAVTVVTYLSFAGALSSSISLPDTPTTRVSQQLEEDFEGTGGGNGAIVAETSDGSAFTSAQQRELVTLFDQVAEVESVADVSDPFATQDQLDSSAEQVADGRRQLNDGLDPAQRRPGADRRRSSGSGPAARTGARRRHPGRHPSAARGCRAAARRRPGRAGPAAGEGRRAGASARAGRDPVRAVVRLPHRVGGRQRRGRQRDLRRLDQRGHRRGEDRDRGPRRRRRHRRGRPLPLAGHRADGPVDPRPGRGGRRRHRRDRPVRHARDVLRRRAAARHRAARRRASHRWRRCRSRAWSRSCPSRRCSA